MPGTAASSLDPSPPRTAAPDPLYEALECLDLRCWIPGPFELTAPWGIQAVTPLGWFYIIAENQCLLEVEGNEGIVPLAAGDLAIVAQGCPHTLRDHPDSPTTPVRGLLEPRHFERMQPLVRGGGGALTKLFCGCFFLDGLAGSPLQAALPPLIHVKGRQQQALPYVNHILRLLELEVADKEHGAHAIVDCLVRLLLTKAVQGCLSELPHGANWLRALADPDIGTALALMHGQPGAAWTVSSLADHVAMARSTFSARFTELIGRPPLEYLTHWRMLKACCLLRNGRAELKEVAAEVGYESTAAFSKAFVRWARVPPGAYRRASLAAAASPPPAMPPI